MKETITITTAEIIAGDIRPFTERLANSHRTWFATPGAISIRRSPFDGDSTSVDAIRAIRRYWCEALRVTPWIPYAMDPSGDIVVELACAAVPIEHIQGNEQSPRLIAFGPQYLSAIQSRWNNVIIAFGLMAGADTGALVRHMDAIRELLERRVDTSSTITE